MLFFLHNRPERKGLLNEICEERFYIIPAEEDLFCVLPAEPGRFGLEPVPRFQKPCYVSVQMTDIHPEFPVLGITDDFLAVDHLHHLP